MRLYTSILFLLPISLFGQVDLINTNLNDSSKSILYIGIDNSILISGLDIDSTFSIIGSKIISRKSSRENEFRVKAKTSGVDTVKLYHHDNLIYEKIFLIDKINFPIPQLGNLNDTVASVEEILENTKLNVIIPNCYFDHRIDVKRFECNFYIKSFNDTIFTNIVYGNRLTSDQINIIKQLESGEKIIFSRINANGADICNLSLEPLTITIR